MARGALAVGSDCTATSSAYSFRAGSVGELADTSTRTVHANAREVASGVRRVSSVIECRGSECDGGRRIVGYRQTRYLHTGVVGDCAVEVDTDGQPPSLSLNDSDRALLRDGQHARSGDAGRWQRGGWSDDPRSAGFRDRRAAGTRSIELCRIGLRGRCGSGSEASAVVDRGIRSEDTSGSAKVGLVEDQAARDKVAARDVGNDYVGQVPDTGILDGSSEIVQDGCRSAL